VSEYRLVRLGKQIQEEISALIVGQKIKDPRVTSLISIHRVDVSKDLSWADVYVSNFESAGALEKAVAGLNSAAGFVQAQLNSRMHIRQTPKLRFHVDTSLKDGFEMIQKIGELDT
jgi:ribosome-binding factor A